MHAVAIIVVLKVFQLSFEIPGIPEHEVVKEFPADRADHSLKEEMREGNRRDAIDLSHFKNAKGGLLAVIGEQGIMIRTQVSWRFLPSDDGIEHVAQGPAIAPPASLRIQ